jgi:hypothetical protein
MLGTMPTTVPVVNYNNSGGCLRCLTFELRGRNRDGAWPAKRMMTASASRAKCHAGGGPRSSEGLGVTRGADEANADAT